MPVHQPRYSKEEAGRRGDEIYDRDIRSQVEPAHNEEIVAIDLDTGAWDMDPDEDSAADRLQARLPDAQIMVMRVGSRYVRRFGAGRSSGSGILADGSESRFNIYDCVVLWDGQLVTIRIDEMDADSLVGMSLMYCYELVLPVLDGAAFTLRCVANP